MSRRVLPAFLALAVTASCATAGSDCVLARDGDPAWWDEGGSSVAEATCGEARIVGRRPDAPSRGVWGGPPPEVIADPAAARPDPTRGWLLGSSEDGTLPARTLAAQGARGPPATPVC